MLRGGGYETASSEKYHIKAYSCAYNTRLKKVLLYKILPFLFRPYNRYWVNYPLKEIKYGVKDRKSRKKWEKQLYKEYKSACSWNSPDRFIDISFIDKNNVARLFMTRHELYCNLLLASEDVDFFIRTSIINEIMLRDAESLIEGDPFFEQYFKYDPQPKDHDFWHIRRRCGQVNPGENSPEADA